MTAKELKELRALKIEYTVLSKKYLLENEYLLSDELDEIRKKIKKNAEKRKKQIERLEKFLDDIDDSELRTIFRLYYVEAWSLDDIAEELCYSEHGVISRKIKRFLESKSK